MIHVCSILEVDDYAARLEPRRLVSIVAPEVSAQPARLDLNDDACRMARDMGLKLAISTDAHSAAGLGNMRFGVDQARRSWLEADDVINTRSLTALRKLLKRA